MRSYRNVWFHTKRYDVATSRGLAQKVGVGVLFWLKKWGWVYCSENQIKAVKGNQRYCLRNVMLMRIRIRVSAAFVRDVNTCKKHYIFTILFHKTLPKAKENTKDLARPLLFEQILFGSTHPQSKFHI